MALQLKVPKIACSACVGTIIRAGTEIDPTAKVEADTKTKMVSSKLPRPACGENVAFSSPVLTTLMLMDTNTQIAFRTSRLVYDDVELTPDEPPKHIRLPSASNGSQSPISRLLHQSLAYCYDRFSRVTSAFSAFQHV